MSRLKHTFAYSLLVLIGILMALLLIAELAEDKVIKIALNKINAEIDANISVGEVDFSLIKGFPDALVEFKDVSISTATDTMAQVDRVYISAEMSPLLRSEFNITEVAVEGGVAYYKVDSLGKTNFDVFLATSEEEAEIDTAESQLLVSLKHLELSNLFCSYTDEQMHVNACLYIDNGVATVFIDEENTNASFKGKLRANNCYYPETKLHLMDETLVDIDVEYLNDVVNLKAITVKTDGAQLQANGAIKQGGSLYTDVHLKANYVDLGELKKYIPDSLFTAYGVKNVSGMMAMQASVKGEVNDSVMPSIIANWSLHNGSIDMAEYPEVSAIHFSGKYSNGKSMNNATTSVGVDTLSFVSGNSWVTINAQLANLDRISYQLNSSVQVDLDELSTFVPDSLVNNLSGTVSAQLSTSGVLPEDYNMQFADYVLERTNCSLQLSEVAVAMDSVVNLKGLNGSLNYQPHQVDLHGLRVFLPDYMLSVIDGNVAASLKGKVADINSLVVDFDNFNISTTDSKLSGEASFSNPDRPVYSIAAQARVDLAEMKVFAPDSLVDEMSGAVSAELSSAGSLKLDSIADDLMEQLFTTGKLLIGFDNASVLTKDPLMQVQQLNGQIELAKDSIRIEDVSGEIAGIAFDADSTLIRNFYRAFWLNQPDTVKVDGYLNLGDIDFVTFAPLMEESDEDNQTELVESSEPANYRFEAKGKVTVKSFWYDNALLENISALYNVSDSLYIVDQLKMDAFKGTTNTSVKVHMLPDDEMKINFKNVTKGLDVNQLLYDFDDFMDYTDEVYISHEQLSGLFSTDNLNGEVTFRGDSIDVNRVKLTTDVRLENGRLNHYPITEEMARDYGFPELKDLQFKTLETKVFVYKGAVFVPLTDVKTNAFDISLTGMQEFNLDCQYHLRFYFKEILRKGKTDRIEKKQASEKLKAGGGVKGLASMYAIYVVDDGVTVKSALEGKDSDAKKKLRSQIYLKEAMAELEFHPLIVKYDTGVNDSE